MVKIKKKRVGKKANSLIKFLIAFSFILVLVLPLSLNIKNNLNYDIASAEVVSSGNYSGSKCVSITYPINKSGLLTMGFSDTYDVYSRYMDNSIDVATLLTYISDYNSELTYVFYKFTLNFDVSKDNSNKSIILSQSINQYGNNSSPVYSYNAVGFLGSLNFSTDNSSLLFSFGFNSDYAFKYIYSINFYYMVFGNNAPSQSDYDKYIEDNNYHSNDDYLSYGESKYNEGREFEKTQLGLEDCSNAISNCSYVNAGSLDNASDYNSMPRTILSSKNVNSNYTKVSYYYWTDDVKLNDIKNQTFIKLDSGVIPIALDESKDFKKLIYSGLGKDALGNDLYTSLKVSFNFGFKNSASNEFLFTFVLENVSWSSDLVVKALPRLKNLCFKLSDDAGNSQIIYGYNVFELYSNYLKNISSPTSDSYYDLGFNDGVNSVDQEADNAQAISDYIEDNNYHSNDDYLSYGESKYNVGFNDAENGKKTLSSLVYSIIDAPFNVLSNAFNFDIFGVNVSGFLIALVSLIIIGFVLRRLL